MEKAGVPRRQAIEAASADASSKRMQRLADDMSLNMRAGATLTEAMQRHPKIFDATITGLIAVGEKTGKLGLVLQKCRELLKRRDEHEAGMRKATRNGKITFAIMVGLSLLQSKTEMPIQAGVLILFYLTVTVGYRHVPPIRRALDVLVLQVPKLGPLVMQNSMALFTGSLAITYSTGIDLRRGMVIAADTIPNLHLRDSIRQVLPRITAGEPMYKAFAASPYVDRLVLTMLRAGETSGNLAHTLNECADFYEKRTADALSALQVYAAPALSIILGLVLYGGL